MLSSTQFLILGAEVTVSHLHMYNVNISSTSVTWGNKISCSSSPWYADYSESVLSSDGLSIYSLFIYGSTKRLYYVCMSASTGNVAATRFRSSVLVSYVYGSALNKDYLIATTFSPNSLVIYGLNTFVFTIKSFSGSQLFGWGVEPSTGR